MNVLRWCTAFVMFIRLCLVFCYDLLDKLYNRIWISLLIKIVQLPNILGNIQNISNVFCLMALLCTFQ